jgi:hypothetical protein
MDEMQSTRNVVQLNLRAWLIHHFALRHYYGYPHGFYHEWLEVEMKKLYSLFVTSLLLLLTTSCQANPENGAQEGVHMIERLASTMHVFGIVFLITAVIAGIAAFIAAMDNEKEATDVAKNIFSKCLVFAVILWVMAWLIS